MTTLDEIFDFGFAIFERLTVRGLAAGGCASESPLPEVSISPPGDRETLVNRKSRIVNWRTHF